MDADNVYRKIAWQQLYKNAMSYIELILEATSHKTAAVRPPTSHLKNIQIRRTSHAEHREVRTNS